MAYDKIKKNVYFDPPYEFPHSSRNHAEDLQDFHVPMHGLHHAALHDRGIAAGLEVQGAAGASALVVSAGVALDALGRMIVLASGGHGDLGSDPPNGTNNEVAEPVQVPLAAVAGKRVYLTIQFSQILRASEGSGGRLEQVPWLRLQPVSGAGAYIDDGSAVVLAIVDVNAAGALASLVTSDGALPHRRTVVGIPASRLRLRTSAKVADRLEEKVGGTLDSDAGGNVRLTVANAAQSITLSREGGAHCQQIAFSADQIVCRDSANRSAIIVDTNNAWVRIGETGNEGDLLVIDVRGNPGFAYNSSGSTLQIGTLQNAGDVYVRNAANNQTLHLEGASSTVRSNNLRPFSGNALDVHSTFLRVHGTDLMLDGRSGRNNRALVDNNDELVLNYAGDYRRGVRIESALRVQGSLQDANGVALLGNPARKVAFRLLFVNSGQTDVQDVDLGMTRRFTALVTLCAIDSLNDFDRDNCVGVDVFQVDGNDNPNGAVSGGDHWGPAGSNSNLLSGFFSGTGRRIRFRLRSFGPDCEAAATGIVFFE